MTVVAADGQYVHPVTVDEFRIAAAETFDVIVEPGGQDAFTIFAQAMDRTGYASGTLAVREGLRAPVPALDPRPILTMADMGMARHGAMSGMRHAGMDHGSHDMASMPGMQMGDATCRHIRPARSGNPLVDMQADGADAEARRPGHRPARQRPPVLTYAISGAHSTIPMAAIRAATSNCT